MSGETFFDFNVKPSKKRKLGSGENKQKPMGGEESKDRKKQHRRKLDDNVWKRTDYATASAADKAGAYGGGTQESEPQQLQQQYSIRKKHTGRKSRKKSLRHKSQRKERLAAEKSDWESMDLTSDEKSDEADDLKERKKRKIRKKKKRSAEGQAEIRHWPSVKLSKKQHRILPRQISDVEIEKGRDDGQEDAIELPESAVSPPAIAPENIVPPSMGPRLDETTKTARCMTSLESTVANELYGAEQPMNIETMYGSSETNMAENLRVELRYWAVLALFIFLVIIYRSFLPPVQCDTAFKQ